MESIDLTGKGIARDNYNYTVNVILFGATILCYVALVTIVFMVLWKLSKRLVVYFRGFGGSRDSIGDSVPYKNMTGMPEKFTSIAVLPAVEIDNHEPQYIRNAFRGPLHARAEAKAREFVL